MEDTNGLASGEEPGNTDQTEISQARAEEQPTVAISPGEVAAPETLADEATMLMPTGNGTPEPTANPAGADEPAPYPQATAYAPNYAQPGYPPTVAYAQPGYPQGIYQQPSMPLQAEQTGLPVPPRKRRTSLWIVLIIVVVLLLGGGTALAIVASQRPTNTPTQALQQFCDGYKALDAQKVYDTLSKDSKSGTSLAQLQQSFDQLKNLGSLVKITDCKVSNVQENGSSATGTITIAETVTLGDFSSSVSTPMSINLVLENTTWKVDTTKMNSHLTEPTFPPNFLTPTVPGSSNQ